MQYPLKCHAPRSVSTASFEGPTIRTRIVRYKASIKARDFLSFQEGLRGVSDGGELVTILIAAIKKWIEFGIPMFALKTL